MKSMTVAMPNLWKSKESKFGKRQYTLEKSLMDLSNIMRKGHGGGN
jgi:hypothetical protein